MGQETSKQVEQQQVGQQEKQQPAKQTSVDFKRSSAQSLDQFKRTSARSMEAQARENEKLNKEAPIAFQRSSEQFVDVTMGVGETVGMNLWNHAKWWGQGVVGIVMFLPMMFYVGATSAGGKKDEKKQESKGEQPNNTPNFVRESQHRMGYIQTAA